jgi:hypothetical protein
MDIFCLSIRGICQVDHIRKPADFGLLRKLITEGGIKMPSNLFGDKKRALIFV